MGKNLQQPVNSIRPPGHWKKDLFDLLLELAVIFVLFAYILGLGITNGHSMEPTLHDGTLLLFNRLSDIEQGDIVVIDSEALHENIVKRVIACPGDTIEIDSGQTYVNGFPLDESYVVNTIPEDEYPFATVPEDCYFVMGDNRPNSMDSRSNLSFIPEQEVLGAVIFHIF